MTLEYMLEEQGKTRGELSLNSNLVWTHSVPDWTKDATPFPHLSKRKWETLVVENAVRSCYDSFIHNILHTVKKPTRHLKRLENVTKNQENKYTDGTYNRARPWMIQIL